MATMVPESIPADHGATVGEKRIFSLLQSQLPDDFRVWFERSFYSERGIDYHPDFVIFSNKIGLIVLEVKDWVIENLNSVDSDTIEFHDMHGRKNKTHPLKQARAHAIALVNKFEKEPALCQSTGQHKGRLRFPWAFAAALVNITRAQLVNAGWDDHFPQAKTYTREEIIQLENQSEPSLLLQRLEKTFPYERPFNPLESSEQVVFQKLLGGGVPQHRFNSEPKTKETFTRRIEIGDQTKTIANRIGNGHQIISGVAGSGKTAILIEKAMQKCIKNPDQDILFACSSKILMSVIQHQLSAFENIKFICVNNPHTTSVVPKKKTTQVKRKLEKLAPTPRSYFDAMFVDQSHNFHPRLFSVFTRFLRKGGDLLAAFDSAQTVYRQSYQDIKSWKDLGIHCINPVHELAIPIRTSKQTFEFAWEIPNHFFQRRGVPNQFKLVNRVAPLTKECRNGPIPIYAQCRDRYDESEFILRTIGKLVEEHSINPADILLVTSDNGTGTYRKSLSEFLGESFPVWNVSTKRGLSSEAIQISLVEPIRGLAFKAVLVFAFETFRFQRNSMTRLYTAMSRATDHLFLSWHGKSELEGFVYGTNARSKKTGQ